MNSNGLRMRPGRHSADLNKHRNLDGNAEDDDDMNGDDKEPLLLPDEELLDFHRTPPVQETSGFNDNDAADVKVMKAAEPGLMGDEKNIAILLFLYVLQGIPLGLSSAIPLILTNRGISYSQQAEYSFSQWPFSLKLLWAPVVDSCFMARFGRRKSWLVPIQYLIGIFMLVLGRNVERYLEAADVTSLTVMFFVLNFLAATQDVVVDGWALTMLQRRNVGYASTCNSVGQTAGYFMGYVGYMVLESYGLATLPDFLKFWGVIFIISTTLVAIFKHEKVRSIEGDDDDGEEHLGVVDTYKMLWKIATLSIMPATIVFLLTSKIGFAASDSVTGLKLVEQGVPKDKLAMLAVPMMPLQILLPWLISRYTSGPRPMEAYVKAIPPRLLMGFAFAGLVWVTPSFKVDPGDGGEPYFPAYYYALVLSLYMVHQVFAYTMFVAIMAFFAKISDPRVGGTYMTFLNTLTNLGGNWPATLTLWGVELLTFKKCVNSVTLATDVKKDQDFDSSNMCATPLQQENCKTLGGQCQVQIDGFYVESVVCVIIGFLWLFLWGRRTIFKLQNAGENEWKVCNDSTSSRKKPLAE